jgi:pSer/pThr/pTyr-binding forkhead associated (FHA) protein
VPPRKDSDDEELGGTAPLGVHTARGGRPHLELHAFASGGRLQTFVLPVAGSLTIGRSRSAEIFIDDPSISRRHALLHVGSTLLLQDLGSQNGTRIGAELLTPGRNAPVPVGAPFLVGAITLVVEPIAAAGEAAAPPARGADPPAPRPAGRPADGARPSLRDEVAELERSRIIEALAACGGNQTKAAAQLGIPRRTLVLRLAEYRIPRPRK